MTVKLISHVNDDGDLIEAWARHYLNLGVGSLHLIVHGPRSQNRRLFDLLTAYPIVIEDAYEGEFSLEEKHRRLRVLTERMRGEWVLLVDSDEFVEFPYEPISRTIRALRLLGSNALYAPMLQRLRGDGSLESPTVVSNPSREFPLCSVDLYRRMGVKASVSKYPLFRCGETAIADGGNHSPPSGKATVLSPLRGVTHHFKWRNTVVARLDARISSAHTWRHQSVDFRHFLDAHAWRLPREGAFVYSREELLRRGLLRRATPGAVLVHVGRRCAAHLPRRVARACTLSYQRVSRILQ